MHLLKASSIGKVSLHRLKSQSRKQYSRSGMINMSLVFHC